MELDDVINSEIADLDVFYVEIMLFQKGFSENYEEEKE